MDIKDFSQFPVLAQQALLTEPVLSSERSLCTYSVGVCEVKEKSEVAFFRVDLTLVLFHFDYFLILLRFSA